MTPEQIFRREKLITAWRAFAQGLTSLADDPSEVLETMATVARNGLNESDQRRRPFKKRGACTCGSHPRRGISI